MSPTNTETNPPISPLGSSLLVRAHEGRTLHAFGHAVVVPLDGKQTGEKFTAFLNITPPGAGPGPHYHEREDEWFYIVEGQVSFLINCTWTEMFPGDCVYAPRGSVHACKNNTDPPIRACSSRLLLRDLNDSSPRQPRSGRNRARPEPHNDHSGKIRTPFRVKHHGAQYATTSERSSAALRIRFAQLFDN